MIFIIFFPEIKLNFFAQFFFLFIFQNYKLLVRGRIQEKLISFFLKGSFQLHSCFNSIFADPCIQIIGKQCVKLDSQKTAFCQKGSLLLHHSHKVLRSFFRKDHCLTAECSYLGSADVEYICISGDILKCHICFRTYQAISKSCSVQKQRKLVFMAYLGNFLQLFLRIKCSVLCRMGNINHSRKYHMVVTFIPIKSFHIICDTFCFDLSVFCRKCQYLMSCILDRSGLMTAYMSSLRRKNTFITVQDRTYDRGIGLGSSHQEKHLCIRAATGFTNLLLCRITVFVRAIAGKLLHIGFQKLLEDRRMGSLAVIVYKK